MISVSESTIKKFLKIFAVLASAAMIASGFFSAPELPEELALFVGRFHPLVVHMPIGFVTAVLLIQLVAIYRRADLRLAVRTLLWFTMISGILSAVFGTLLAIPGGYDEVLLERHRWLGIGTSIACIWMLVAHQSNRKQRDMLYSLCLLICMGLVGAYRAPRRGSDPWRRLSHGLPARSLRGAGPARANRSRNQGRCRHLWARHPAACYRANAVVLP